MGTQGGGGTRWASCTAGQKPNAHPDDVRNGAQLEPFTNPPASRPRQLEDDILPGNIGITLLPLPDRPHERPALIEGEKGHGGCSLKVKPVMDSALGSNTRTLIQIQIQIQIQNSRAVSIHEIDSRVESSRAEKSSSHNLLSRVTSSLNLTRQIIELAWPVEFVSP